MTTMQTILGKILTNRINEEKAKATPDFTEITNVMNILLAGGSITSDQYAELETLITSTTTA